MPAILPHDIHNALVDICNKIPVGWKEIMGSDVSDHTDKTDLVSLCVEGRVMVQMFYRWLLENKFKVKPKAITARTVDLQVEHIPENWTKICKCYFVVYNPVLQDFARSFLLRSYYLNMHLSQFTDISEKCTFCKVETETIMHVYWLCPKVRPLWDRVTELISQYLPDAEKLTPMEALLSCSTYDVIVLIMLIVKYQIFLSRLNDWPVQYTSVLHKLRKERNNHLYCTAPEKMSNYYSFWQDLAFGYSI